MNKFCGIIFISAIMMLLYGCNSKVNQIANIDGDMYYNTGKKVEMVDRMISDGIIENFYDPQIMPDMIDSANFGSEYEALPYKYEEDDRHVDIKIGEVWYRFERKSEQQKPVAKVDKESS